MKRFLECFNESQFLTPSGNDEVDAIMQQAQLWADKMEKEKGWSKKEFVKKLGEMLGVEEEEDPPFSPGHMFGKPVPPGLKK